MKIEKILAEFGFTEKETQVYLANLSLGTATVQTISTKAGTHRTYTYEVLKSLKEKGIVSYVIKSKKQYFECSKPTKLIAILNEKKDKIKSILPDLQEIYQSATEKPSVEVYEGKAGLNTIFNDIIQEKKEILNLTSGLKLYTTLQFEFPNFVKHRIEKKIPARIITERTEQTIKDKKQDKSFRKMKFLPKNKILTNATFISGNKVAIISLDKELLGIVIHNKEIAKNYEVLFNLLWDISDE